MSLLVNLPHVSEVIEFRQTQSHEIFRTKSGGQLSIAFALPIGLVDNFFLYNDEELRRIPEDIRGLRKYSVENLPLGQVGGTEFHRIRKEIVMGICGQVEWECEDIYGEKRKFVLSDENGIWMPPFILHTYFVQKNKSGLTVLCNTLFPLPANEATNDTYSHKEFVDFQKDFLKKRPPVDMGVVSS